MTNDRRNKTFKVLAIIALLYGALLLIPGVALLIAFWRYGVHEWQEISMAALLFSFAPFVGLGFRRASMAARLFFIGAALSVLQVLGLISSTGDGTGGMVVGALAVIGLPMALTGLLFRWQSRWVD